MDEAPSDKEILYGWLDTSRCPRQITIVRKPHKRLRKWVDTFFHELSHAVDDYCDEYGHATKEAKAIIWGKVMAKNYDNITATIKMAKGFF